MNSMAMVPHEAQTGLMKSQGWLTTLEQADYLVKSQFLPKAINTKEKAVAVMMMGQELGIGPMQSFQGIDIIEGKPAVSPKLRLALAKKSGVLESFNIKFNQQGTACTVSGKRKGEEQHSVTFSMDDANKAGLTKKFNWSAYQRNMLQWRAVGYFLDAVCPDICGGYCSADELGAVTDADGRAVDSPPQVINPEPPSPVSAPEQPKDDEIIDAPIIEKPAAPAAPPAQTATEQTASTGKGKGNGMTATIMNLYQAVKKLKISEQEFKSAAYPYWGVTTSNNLTKEQIQEWVRFLNTHKTKEAFLGAFTPPQQEEEEESIPDDIPFDAEPERAPAPVTPAPASRLAGKRGL